MGATMYLMTCPDDPSDELLAPALTVAIDRDIQLMQLTGTALTSGHPVTHAVLQAPEGGPLRERRLSSGPYIHPLCHRHGTKGGEGR